MTLYMIGLGLGNKFDITVNGLETVKNCNQVFLESYTSIYGSDVEELSEFFGKEVIVADRNMVESCSDKILENAKNKTVAFLVVGDVFSATTHSDLYLRAKEKGIDVKIINNASILNAIGITGLELYKFGATTSIVFDHDNWLPETSYHVIEQNLKNGLHTLCLLDIKTAEPSKENLLKGINKPEPPRFLTINHAIKILLKLEDKVGNKILSENTLAVGVARLGQEDFKIKSGTLKELKEFDFGKPLHSLIIPGKLHEIESKMLEKFN